MGKCNKENHSRIQKQQIMTNNSEFPQNVSNQMALLSYRLLIDTYFDDYIRLVQRFLFDKTMEKRALVLLPFDRQIQTVARILGCDHPIASMGFCLMRMEMEPAMFSFGISLEFKDGNEQVPISSVSFITACKTIENLRNWVHTEGFKNEVRAHFNKMISDVFRYTCRPAEYAENQRKVPNTD